MRTAARKLIVGNWKMNGSRAEAETLIKNTVAATRGVAADLALCVPFTLLELAGRLLRDAPVALGAQDVSEHERGAFTGQVSATMLEDLGCRYVIVGHSERRSLQNESDATVAAKATAALKQGLVPIFCVGESLQQREAGQTDAVVCRQLDALLAVLAADGLLRCVIAYEPVWAIGTGRSATPAQAQAVHAAIRRHLAGASPDAAAATRILYGGSVSPATAEALLAQSDIDGALVGGASLVPSDFAAIAASATLGR